MEEEEEEVLTAKKRRIRIEIKLFSLAFLFLNQFLFIMKASAEWQSKGMFAFHWS